MFGLKNQPLVIRVLAGALVLAAFAWLVFISLLGYAFEGGGKTPLSWQFAGVGVAGCFLALASLFARDGDGHFPQRLFQRLRRWAWAWWPRSKRARNPPCCASRRSNPT
jgi:hypothetical protein